jgi:hypothetical protein
VTVDDVTTHRMHAEWGEVAGNGGRRDQRDPRRGRSDHPRRHHGAASDRNGGGRTAPCRPFEGETDIFIYPGYAWRMTDALMTNFHLPKSTLMMLVSALMGRDRVMEIYAHAIAGLPVLFLWRRVLAHSVANLTGIPVPVCESDPRAAPNREGAGMINVVRASWALLLGMFLLQIGNGLQGSLMAVRGAIEGFSTVELSMIASAYFVGFLGGSRLAPKFIARVGHVRVFAALGSLISAVLIAFRC